jgi:hypothetical protein
MHPEGQRRGTSEAYWELHLLNCYAGGAGMGNNSVAATVERMPGSDGARRRHDRDKEVDETTMRGHRVSAANWCRRLLVSNCSRSITAVSQCQVDLVC